MRLYTDGACSGNPGPAAVAWLIVDRERVLLEGSEYLGQGTNNIAEYTAIIKGLEACIARGYRDIRVLSDSQLCIRQINGEYKVKKGHLKTRYKDVQRLRQEFGRIEFKWVEREDEWIVRCDEMARTNVEEDGRRM